MSRTWTVRLPWTKPPLSLNDRSHWRKKAADTADVRRLARLFVEVQTQYAVCERVAVTLTYCPRDKRRRDADNLVSTLKAVCDGIVDAHLVADDTPEFMVKHMPEIGEPTNDPCLILTIEELT